MPWQRTKCPGRGVHRNQEVVIDGKHSSAGAVGYSRIRGTPPKTSTPPTFGACSTLHCQRCSQYWPKPNGGRKPGLVRLPWFRRLPASCCICDDSCNHTAECNSTCVYLAPNRPLLPVTGCSDTLHVGAMAMHEHHARHLATCSNRQSPSWVRAYIIDD